VGQWHGRGENNIMAPSPNALNASPSLFNEDLAPAEHRNWGAFSLFNVWTSDVHSLWGYYLAASLFLLCGNFVNFVLAIGTGSIVIFLLTNLVGYAGVRTGVPYPVLARESFGVFGANLPALVRAIVACFWYGAQTAAASGAIVALLTRWPFDIGSDLFRRSLGTTALDHSARNGDCAALPGLGRTSGLGNDVGSGRRTEAHGWLSIWGGIPQDVLLEKTRDAGVPGTPGSFASLAGVAATWVTYFAALYLNFCDFSRYAPNEAAVRKGNIWACP